MPCYMVSSSVQSLQTHLVVDKVGFAKMILLRLTICHLVRLKRCHLKLSKNDYMLEQNWSNIELLPQFA